jgi:hypothetical protein
MSDNVADIDIDPNAKTTDNTETTDDTEACDECKTTEDEVNSESQSFTEDMFLHIVEFGKDFYPEWLHKSVHGPNVEGVSPRLFMFLSVLAASVVSLYGVQLIFDKFSREQPLKEKNAKLDKALFLAKNNELIVRRELDEARSRISFRETVTSNTEDFTCVEYLYGCMDEEALNYDSLANTENNSCIDIITGCMDPNAYNYSDSANVDSDNCNFDAGCITGPGNPYWLNDPCYAWVISVDDYCCDNEWDDICQLTYNYCDGTYIGPLLSRVKEEKKLLSITDVLGRPIKETKNKLLFYIYDDGTVEKKLIKH